MAEISSRIDRCGAHDLADRMDRLADLASGSSDWFYPGGDLVNVEVPPNVLNDHWQQGIALIPQMEQMGFTPPESDSATDVIGNMLTQGFLRKTSGYGRLTYTLGSIDALQMVEKDVWDEILAASRSGKDIGDKHVDVLVYDPRIGDVGGDVVSFTVGQFVDSGQSLPDFYRSTKPSSVDRWLSQFAGGIDATDRRMVRLAESDEEILARWHARDAEREAARERYYRESYPRLVAQMLLSGFGPEEIARRSDNSIARVMEAIERIREDDPDFDRRMIEEMEEHERRLRETDLSPSEYDPTHGLLRTENDDYERARDSYERLVGEPNLIETGGMELPVDMGDLDPSLAGWFGAHTGDSEGWFPTLVHDQFLDSPGQKYVIDSDTIPLFRTPDPHPIDRGEVPESEIVFTHPSLLPEGRPFIPPGALRYEGPLNIEDYPDEGDEFGDDDDDRYASTSDRWIRIAMPQVPTTSTQGARGMFGPMWHGTTPENRERIREEGFRYNVEEARQGNTTHGFQNVNVPGHEFPYPVHFLGFGVYFASNKNVAKMYNQGTTKGFTADTFYADVDPERVLEINFASPEKMTKWWIENGYDPELAKKDRVAATQRMTEVLSSKYDAVHFVGRGYMGKRTLDANQVCVYDPSKIVRLDRKMDPVVVRKSDGMKGKLLDSHTGTFTPREPSAEGMRSDGQARVFFLSQHPWVANVTPGQVIQDHDGTDVTITEVLQAEPVTRTRLTVQWQRGGMDRNVRPEDVDIIQPQAEGGRR